MDARSVSQELIHCFGAQADNGSSVNYVMGNLFGTIGDLCAARTHFKQAYHSLVEVGKATKQPTTAMCIYKQARLSLQEKKLEEAR